MAVKSSDQISIVDVTDAYSVILTSESHTFLGSTSAAIAASTTTQVIAMQGASQVACSVTVGNVTAPTGVTVSSDGDTTAPTLTISVSSSVNESGTVTIPVYIASAGVTIEKVFSYGIAFTGASGTSVSISGTSVTYAAGTSGTTAPTTGWSGTIPSVSEGQYLWTKTVVTYSDGASTTSYSVSYVGVDGTSVSISGTSVTYVASDSGTTTPTTGWSGTIPSVSAGQYLWTKTVVTYSDGTSTTSYSVSYVGIDGSDGADAITMSITSSNGTIFKNSAISTVLTAHVYQAGVELTTAQIAALGTIYWYKDGSGASSASGQTLTIDAGDVDSKATYIAQLEG
ncbi:MAG: hypothetical protein LUC30_10350 [Clostridiales bacterium]|nr:hypothetical protein [Clostridiales bacterium]